MNRNAILSSTLFALLWYTGAPGQSAGPQSPGSMAYGNSALQGGPSPPAGSPQSSAVSYASVTQLNGLLAQLEAASKAAQTDLAKLRIEKWKTDGGSKKRSLGDVDSVQRNLQNALPEMIAKLRNAPEDLSATFRLYRNLD